MSFKVIKEELRTENMDLISLVVKKNGQVSKQLKFITSIIKVSLWRRPGAIVRLKLFEKLANKID